MDVLLSTLKYEPVLILLNDIVDFSRNTIIHMAHLRQVLTLLREAGVTAKLSEFSFCAKTIGTLEDKDDWD